jgi:polyhydroxybutyrate depolymerase
MLHALLLAFLFGVSQPTGPSTLPQAPSDQPATIATPIAHAAPSTPKHMEWTIDGVKREGTIYLPATATTQPNPVVFGFHGHGGNARNAARTFKMHEQWPEAIVVYLQGLPTPGAITDPKGERNGWQKTVGDQGDRDLKFFDAVLADLRKTYKVDDARIYATGHSNGGAFTYLLWSARGDTFAALAPCAAGGNLLIMTNLKPKPVFHIAGKQDPLVTFAFQQRIMDQDRKINNCETEGKEWGGEKNCTIYKSKGSSDTPVITMIHDGAHTYTKEAPALVVKFFKEHAKTEKSDDKSHPSESKPATAVSPAH